MVFPNASKFFKGKFGIPNDALKLFHCVQSINMCDQILVKFIDFRALVPLIIDSLMWAFTNWLGLLYLPQRILLDWLYFSEVNGQPWISLLTIEFRNFRLLQSGFDLASFSRIAFSSTSFFSNSDFILSFSFFYRCFGLCSSWYFQCSCSLNFAW